MKTLFAALLFPLSLLGLLLVGIAVFFLTLPDVREMKGCLVTSMYEVKLCPGEANYVPFNQIAPEMIDALVASEDASFFSHQGFDWHELRESFTTNLQNAGFKRGGSTLTQQLAKNVFLSKEKSVLRKLREAVLTVQIEKNFSKQEILERYLNVVEFGPNLYGIKAASQKYFGKSPSQLHVLDAAFLAFLLPNPKSYSQSFNKRALTPFARKMVRQIVRRLAAFKKISPQTMQTALDSVDQFPWGGISRQALNDGFSPDQSTLTDDQIRALLEQEVESNVSGLKPRSTAPSTDSTPIEPSDFDSDGDADSSGAPQPEPKEDATPDEEKSTWD